MTSVMLAAFPTCSRAARSSPESRSPAPIRYPRRWPGCAARDIRGGTSFPPLPAPQSRVTARCKSVGVARHARLHRRSGQRRLDRRPVARSSCARRRTGAVENIGPHRRETWSDDRGRAVIERYDIAGMGHGTPLDTRGGEVCGVAGPHMLEVGICSTSRIAAFWGIADSIVSPRPAKQARHTPHLASRPANSVETIIEDALRWAGLMR